jgi:hypothetical protein
MARLTEEKGEKWRTKYQQRVQRWVKAGQGSVQLSRFVGAAAVSSPPALTGLTLAVDRILKYLREGKRMLAI